MDATSPSPVLLFDGECALCNRVVRLLLWLDRRKTLRFAALQGCAGQNFLRRHGLPADDFDSLVFVPDWPGPERGGYLQRTDGLLAALRACGGWGEGLAAVLAICPRGWRDAGYRAVARSRYRIFGAWQPQPWPRPEWAERFLP